MKLYQILSWKLLKVTFGIFSRLYYKIECIKDQIEPKPPFVLLSNHFHELDSFFIGGDQKVKIISIKSTFSIIFGY